MKYFALMLTIIICLASGLLTLAALLAGAHGGVEGIPVLLALLAIAGSLIVYSIRPIKWAYYLLPLATFGASCLTLFGFD